MTVNHETKQNLIDYYDFCAFGLCTPLRYTQR